MANVYDTNWKLIKAIDDDDDIPSEQDLLEQMKRAPIEEPASDTGPYFSGSSVPPKDKPSAGSGFKPQQDEPADEAPKDEPSYVKTPIGVSGYGFGRKIPRSVWSAMRDEALPEENVQLPLEEAKRQQLDKELLHTLDAHQYLTDLVHTKFKNAMKANASNPDIQAQIQKDYEKELSDRRGMTNLALWSNQMHREQRLGKNTPHTVETVYHPYNHTFDPNKQPYPHVNIEGKPHQVLGIRHDAKPEEITAAHAEATTLLNPKRLSPGVSQTHKDNYDKVMRALDSAKDAMMQQHKNGLVKTILIALEEKDKLRKIKS